MTSYFKSKTLTGLSWSIVSQVGRQGTTFVVGIVLARLLSPEEFGLIAMVTIITGFASLFAELGFGSAIIQKEEVWEVHLSSVFWLNIGSGALLTLVFVAGSDLVANFYDEPILQPITAVLAFNFLIGSTAIVQRSLYTKAIDFKSLFIVQISTSVVSGGIAVYLAFEGFGVWSLVWRGLLYSFFEAILLWVLSTWKPRFLFNWNKVKELLGFSLNLLGEKLINYSARNVDDLLIGKFIGSGGLGIYSKAYSLMLFPLRNVSSVISKVMFPSLSTIQEDKARVKKVFVKMTKSVALITFPVMSVLFVVADLFVIEVLGEQWIAMIPILRIFCVLGMIQSINTLVGSLFLSQGRTDILFKLGLVVKVWIVSAIVFGLKWGVMGVALSYSIASIVAFIPEMHYGGKLVNLKVVDVLKNLSPFFLLSFIMGIMITLINFLLGEQIEGLLKLIILIASGAIIYIFLLVITNNNMFNELRRLVSDIKD